MNGSSSLRRSGEAIRRVVGFLDVEGANVLNALACPSWTSTRMRKAREALGWSRCSTSLSHVVYAAPALAASARSRACHRGPRFGRRCGPACGASSSPRRRSSRRSARPAQLGCRAAGNRRRRCQRRACPALRAARARADSRSRRAVRPRRARAAPSPRYPPSSRRNSAIGG